MSPPKDNRVLSGEEVCVVMRCIDVGVSRIVVLQCLSQCFVTTNRILVLMEMQSVGGTIDVEKFSWTRYRKEYEIALYRMFAKHTSEDGDT